MIFSERHIAFTYHGVHTRPFTNSTEVKLFRNSIPEAALRNQLSTLKGLSIKKDGVDGNITLSRKYFFFEDFSISITFDDGYRNNFRAAEIFYEFFGVAPFNVFLTTNLVGSKRSIWTVELALTILQAQFLVRRIEFSGEFFNVACPQERLETFNSIRYRVKEMNAENRKFHCDSIQEQTLPGELERLLFEYPEFQMLNLDEIKQMQSMGVRFQPHGHNHEIFHANQDPDVIRREIVESKEFMENHLNEKCTYFAYPNGDYCDAAISILKENSFSGAYTTNVGIAETLERNYEIPRLTPSSKLRKFKRQLRGKTD